MAESALAKTERRLSNANMVLTRIGVTTGLNTQSRRPSGDSSFNIRLVDARFNIACFFGVRRLTRQILVWRKDSKKAQLVLIDLRMLALGRHFPHQFAAFLAGTASFLHTIHSQDGLQKALV